MTLADIIATLRKRLLPILVASLVAAGAAAAYAYWFVQDQYTASTTLFVFARDTASDGNSDLGYGALSLGYSLSDMVAHDVADLVTTEYVQEQAAEALGMSSLAAYQVTASANEESRMIRISATAADPDDAIAVADSVARASIETSYQIMRVQSVRVIDEAQIVYATTLASKVRIVGIAFAGTAIAASALVIFAKMLDTCVRDARTAEAVSGMSTLGAMPAAPFGSALFSDENGVEYGKALDAARVVLANLRFLGSELPVNTIAVTSPTDGESRAALAYLLAQSIAHDDRSVLLVEYDCHSRSLAGALGVSPGQGIASVLSRSCTAEQAICRVGLKKLFFLDAEADIENSTALLTTARFKRLFDQLGEKYPCVIICAPSLESRADASILASVCDATILAVQRGLTQREQLSRGAEQLQRTGAVVAGVVMLDPQSGRVRRRGGKGAA